jgi:hypothetical protein
MLALAILWRCAPEALGQNDFVINEQMFNQWLFSANQGHFDPDSELTLHVEAVNRICGLNEPQKEKLRLAGRGDYSRFGRQVDDLRAKYVGKTFNQNELGTIYQKIQPLGLVYQTGLLGKDSLFSKVLANTLTKEQSTKLDEIESARRQSRYVAKVKLFVVMLEGTCPLTDKQRMALVDLIVAETEPPKRYGQFDSYVVLYQANKIADEKFEQMLDDAQLRQLRVTLRQGAGMEQFLRQQKILE